MRHLLCLWLLPWLAATPAVAIGPPINTDTPITLGLEGRGVRSFAKVIRASNDRLDGRVTTTLLPVAIPYNMTTKGVAGLIVPMVFKELRRSGTTTSSSGLGDISLFAKYVVVQMDRHQQTLRLAPKVVLKLPTGDEEGAPALGSGSTDLSLGVVGARLKGRLGLYAEGQYQVTGKGNGRQFGNGLAYNLALAYRLVPAVYETYPARQLNGYLEFIGSWHGRDTFKGGNVLDSGGHLLFLAPGLQYIPLSWLLFETSLQLPLLKNVNGTQMEPDWTVVAGLRVLLY